jgi:hypothetical protein
MGPPEVPTGIGGRRRGAGFCQRKQVNSYSRPAADAGVRNVVDVTGV